MISVLDSLKVAAQVCFYFTLCSATGSGLTKTMYLAFKPKCYVMYEIQIQCSHVFIPILLFCHCGFILGQKMSFNLHHVFTFTLTLAPRFCAGLCMQWISCHKMHWFDVWMNHLLITGMWCSWTTCTAWFAVLIIQGLCNHFGVLQLSIESCQ